MTRKLSVLFVLAFFVMSLASVAFAAKAKIADQRLPLNINETPVPKIAAPADYEIVGAAATSGKPIPTQSMALGYYMLEPGEVQVGITEYDWQNPESPGRRVVIGTDNKIHTVFTERAYGQDPVADRYINYNGYTAGGGIPLASPVIISPASGAFPSIGVGLSEALSIATYGYLKPIDLGHAGPYDDRARIAIGKQGGVFSVFSMYDYPSSDTVMSKFMNCDHIKTGMDTLEGGPYWPRIAIDQNGSGQTIAHVLTKEVARTAIAGGLGGDTTGKSSIVYYRTLPDAAFPGTTCGTFIDSTDVGRNIDIVAAPGLSQKVAAVYFYPLVWSGFDRYIDNNDIFYKESSDLGATWSTNRIPVLMPGKVDSVGELWQRADEFSALYDTLGCLHVLYTTSWHDPVAHTYYPTKVRLYHWSSCNPTCLVMLKDGNSTWAAAVGATPNQEMLIYSPSLTMCKVGGVTRLYAVYNMFCDSTAITGHTWGADASTFPMLNGDVVAQGSTSMDGSLWGPQVNLTNTNSNLCNNVAMNCKDESFSTSAPFVNDTLRIQYLFDIVAGEGAARTTEDVLSPNPMIIKSYPCFAVASEASLTSSLDSIAWPFHTVPGGTSNVPMTLINTGSANANYTRTVSYNPSITPWLTFANGATGTVPCGCTYTLGETITALGPATEGLFRATITWTYSAKTLVIPVALYNYTAAHWFVEGNNFLKTAWEKTAVNQSSRVGKMRTGAGFGYFSDIGDTAYLYDGSLLIGKDSLSLSMGLFADTTPFSGGVGGHGDTLLGRLFCLSDMTFDSTGTYPTGYRHASGKGCNKDSTIAFDVNFYAPRHVDSANFMIGKFSLYAGPKDTNATINNVLVCYTADWDIPDDSADNIGGVDAVRQMVYQAGKWGTNATRYGGMSGWREDGVAAAGGTVLMNRRSIHRLSGYVTDSAWTMIKGMTGFTGTDSVGDMHELLVLSKGATITPKHTGMFTVYVIYAGQPGPREPSMTGSLDGLKAEVCKAKAFVKANIWSGMPLCPTCNNCGDADGNNTINISDAVFLIAYIFAHGTAPGDCIYPFGKGDADGNGTVNISDAVYLIAYIFAHGNAPHCNGL